MHSGIKFSPQVFKGEQLPASLDRGKMSQLVSWLTSMDCRRAHPNASPADGYVTDQMEEGREWIEKWVSVHWVDLLLGTACAQGPATETGLDGGHQNSAHVCRSISTHNPCAHNFSILGVRHALFLKKKRKTQTQSSCFLTTSNHISQKCLLIRSTDPSQNFSHVLIKMCVSSIVLSCYRTCVCPLLFCQICYSPYKSGLTLCKKYDNYYSIDTGHLSILVYINLSYLYLNVFLIF